MIRKDLLDLEYYLNRLSKFMKESYGINEQVETFYSLLAQVNSYYDDFYNQLNFMKTSNPEGALLDLIGAIFGCRRNFNIPIYDPDHPLTIIGYTEVNLNDSEFLTYIKTQLIKQNFDGRRETLQKLYATYIDGQLSTDHLLDLIFIYLPDGDSGNCKILWNTNESPLGNLGKLFINGYLTIESLGINYTREITNVENLAYYFDQPWEENPSPVPVGESSNYYAVEKFVLLTTKPADWDENESKYYKMTTATIPWDNSKKYATNDADLIYQKYQPANITITTTDYVEMDNLTSESWAANTYYSLNLIKGGLYI